MIAAATALTRSKCLLAKNNVEKKTSKQINV